MISEVFSLKEEKSWWVDSGATRHVCNDQTMFKTYEPSYSMLYMGNHSTAQVKGKGKIDLVFTCGNILTLNDVLHVPDVRNLSSNLISSSSPKVASSLAKAITPNGIAERKNHTLMDMVNSMMLYSGLSSGYWGEALLTACYILNRVPSKRSIKTELWNQRTPKLDNLRIWGCRAIVRLPESKKRKLRDKGIECIFLGYAQNSKAYRFIVVEPNDLISVNTIIESRDARFDENRFKTIPKAHEIFNETVSTKIPITTKGNNDDSFSDHQQVEPRRSTRQRRQRTFGPDFEMYQVEGDRKCLIREYSIIYNLDEDPQTYSEAMKSHDSSFWKEVVNDEMDSIIGNNTWILVGLPPGSKAIKRLSRHTSSPGKEHWDAVNRVFKYLKKTMDYGLEYSGDPSVLEGYTDASWITEQEDYASTSGWIFTLGGGAVSWGSKKQSCLTDSTMSAEFVALASCCKEAEWQRDLLINIPLWPKPMPPISMHCDSQSTLLRAYNQVYNGKSRHIRLRHRQFNQLINDGVITVSFLRSSKNLVDPFTKGLPRKLIEISREAKVHHLNVTRSSANLIIILGYGNILDNVHLSECGSEAASYELKGLALKHFKKPRYRPKANLNGSAQSGLNEREE
ncbi:zinc finger, CCHC-type containing protein [Tanacetum coccineum]